MYKAIFQNLGQNLATFHHQASLSNSFGAEATLDKQ